MKIAMSMLLALALSVAAMARQSSTQTSPNDQNQSSASQSQTSPSQSQNSTDQNQATSTQNSSSGDTRMSGKVSKGAKSFTNDANSRSYRVSNPDALTGHEGEHVVVLVHVDPDTGTIHITQLAPPQ